jgi:hypothetical protein
VLSTTRILHEIVRQTLTGVTTALQQGFKARRPEASSLTQDSGKDLHSYSNPEQIKVRHLDLDLQVSRKEDT